MRLIKRQREFSGNGVRFGTFNDGLSDGYVFMSGVRDQISLFQDTGEGAATSHIQP
ncbi:hypothetical protein [Mesorhizobium sp. A623]